MLLPVFVASQLIGAVAADPPRAWTGARAAAVPDTAVQPLGVRPDTGAAPRDTTERRGLPRDTSAGDGLRASALARPVAVGARPDTSPAGRPRAIVYSDWYARRLAIHRVGSYAMLPLFAGEFALGERLLSSNPQPGWVRSTHKGVAYGLGALFVTNTVTGAWNLWDARKDPSGRTRRWVHAALLLAADAGFAYTGSLAEGATRSDAGRDRHRAAALTSMGVATVGTAMMWLWKD